MSGYHPDTGIFELTGSKAGYWFRRTDIPPSCEGLVGMPFFAVLLSHYGHEIVKMGNNYLHVRATPGQVWEALSGKPSDPSHEQHYIRHPASGGVTTVKREGVRLLPSEIIALFKDGSDGSGDPIRETSASGASSCRICGKLINKGITCFRGGYDFNQGMNGRRPTICYIHTSCLHPTTSTNTTVL